MKSTNRSDFPFFGKINAFKLKEWGKSCGKNWVKNIDYASEK